MKTIVSINLGNHGSTGKIMHGISLLARENGYMVFEAYPDNPNNYPKNDTDIIIESFNSYRISRKLSIITGYNGCFAFLPTLRFIHRLNRIKPDIIHIHNLHNSYINLPILFKYIKKKKISVVWTLHDCWSFTGRCPYFQITGCDKWREGCGDCPYPQDEYPETKKDKTSYIWGKKRKWFTGVDNLVIVTPSEWLAGLVKESFLSEYQVMVINNGIDLEVFKPTDIDLRNRIFDEAEQFADKQ